MTVEVAAVLAAYSLFCQRVLQHYVAAASGTFWASVSKCVNVPEHHN